MPNGVDITVPKAQNCKKLVANQRRCEGVYNRVADVCVTFCEKGAATEHLKKGRKIATFLIAAKSAATWQREQDSNPYRVSQSH